MSDVTCASGVELLMDYLEGVLLPETARDLEAHVAGCPRCRAYVQSYRETPRIVREATAASLPPELGQSLMESLRKRLR
jgi:anti-sigma factor RsiW